MANPTSWTRTQLGAVRHSAVFRIIKRDGTAHVVTPTGRAAWLMETLCEAGPTGLTAADLPAGLRLAAYVQRLRRAGVPITTSSEPNSGAWGGSHGRYRLDCRAEREGEP
jgi:hypothetical protein